jgi:hypothetical protein
MSSNRRVVSVGKWWEWDASLWGTRDRAEAAQMGIGQQELGKMPAITAQTQPRIGPARLLAPPAEEHSARRTREVGRPAAREARHPMSRGGGFTAWGRRCAHAR